PSCHAGLVILEIVSPFPEHVPEGVGYRQIFVCSPPLCAVPVRCALYSFLLGHGFRGGGFHHAATDAVPGARTARPDAGGGLRSGRFSALARCVASPPPLPASARGSGALPQPLDGCFPCRYDMLRRLRGCAHRSAVPAPHPAAFPRQHGASPQLGSVGVPYAWGVPPVFFYHTLCPEATPQIHPAMATNVMTSQTVEHVMHPS